MARRLKTRLDEVWLHVGGMEVKARPLSRREILGIKRKHTRFKAGREQLDEYAFMEELFTRQVVDWRDALDWDGNPLPYSEEAKRDLFNTDPDFANEVAEAIEAYTEERSQAEEKNSGTGAGGTSPQAG